MEAGRVSVDLWMCYGGGGPTVATVGSCFVWFQAQATGVAHFWERRGVFVIVETG